MIDEHRKDNTRMWKSTYLCSVFFLSLFRSQSLLWTAKPSSVAQKSDSYKSAIADEASQSSKRHYPIPDRVWAHWASDTPTNRWYVGHAAAHAWVTVLETMHRHHGNHTRPDLERSKVLNGKEMDMGDHYFMIPLPICYETLLGKSAWPDNHEFAIFFNV